MEYTSVGKRIRVARILSNKPRAKDFAEAADCHPVTLSKLEGGTMKLSDSMAEAFARVAGVTPAWLLTGEGEGPDLSATDTTSPEAA